MTISLSEFLAQLAANPVLAVTVALTLGVVLVNYYFSRRCPRCHKLTLKQQSQQVLSVTRSYRLVEYTYVCSNCGAAPF
mgnify:FL=1